MHGNVYEFCNDWYGDYLGNETDPVGPTTGNLNTKILRGGERGSHAHDCRSANRYSAFRDKAYFNYGFRPVRSIN